MDEEDDEEEEVVVVAGALGEPPVAGSLLASRR